MYRKVQWAFATLGAGLLISAGQAAATTITSTSYSEWQLGLTGSPTELDFTPISIGKEL